MSDTYSAGDAAIERARSAWNDEQNGALDAYKQGMKPVWEKPGGPLGPGISGVGPGGSTMRFGIPAGSITGLGGVPYDYDPDPRLTAEVFASKYGYAAAFLEHPEVGPILRTAARRGWGEEELYGAISQTTWWKNTSDNARSWEMLVNEDPATASRVAAELAATIQNRARTLGVTMSGDQITSLARTAAQNGWTEDQVIDRLVAQASWSTLAAGDLTANRDKVKAMASEYLVNVSDATAQQYAARMASGEMSEDGVRSAFQRQARSRFAWMADDIDQGVTPSMYLDPIKQTIAAELEVAPDEVNLMDGEYLGMVEVPGEDGKMRAATIREAQLSARKDPRWKNTSRAQAQISRTASFIQEAMGRRSL